MSKIKGFDVLKAPQKDAERWFDLYRSGKRNEAGARLTDKQRETRRASDAAVDARLDEMARSRRS
ncbi:MAG: hypothetical protein ABI885_03150 [Gammaproteobacteria bacterium]